MKLSQNWKKYFIEFLMLFLAIFLGFIADNYRDKISEKSKEKEYIKSLIEDIRTDNVNISSVIKNNFSRKSNLDKLSRICFNFNPKSTDYQELYRYYPIVITRPDFFIPNELTMLQLKNAGGMRLIQNKNAVKAILKYDLQKTLVFNQQKYYENYHNKAIDVGLKIFNHQQLREMVNQYKTSNTVRLNSIKFQLIHTNKETIYQFANEVDMYSGIVDYYTTLLKTTKKEADSLIIKLKKEYKIK